MSDLKIVTLAGDAEGEASLAAALSRRDDVEIVLRCVDRIELLASIRSGGIDAIVSVGAPMWFDRGEADEAARGGVRVVGVVSDPLDADRLAALGAALVPSAAPADEVIDRCRFGTVVPPTAPSAPETASGRLVAVWGPKGSPGRTRTAVELSFELASGNDRTILVDADPYGGDIVQMLGVTEELPSVVWAARAAARDVFVQALSSGDLRRAGRHGPVVLPGLPRADLWADVSDFGWRKLLDDARQEFDFVVCDTGFCIEEASASVGPSAGRNRMTRNCIESATHVIAVCAADPIGVKNFVWAFDDLRDLADDAAMLVVVNRASRGTQAEVADMLLRHAGVRPVAFLPDRPSEIARALTAGIAVRELDARSELTGAIRSLASRIGGDVRPRGVLARLAGRA